MRGNETPHPICIKIYVKVDIPDVITGTNFGDDRLRGLRVAGLNVALCDGFCRRPSVR